MSTTLEGPGWSGSQPRRRPRRRRRRLNVGRNERIASLVAGVLLGGISMRRRGRLGLLLSVASAELVSRGLTGHCRVYAALGITDVKALAPQVPDVVP